MNIHHEHRTLTSVGTVREPGRAAGADRERDGARGVPPAAVRPAPAARPSRHARDSVRIASTAS